jgi:hypothetical protein
MTPPPPPPRTRNDDDVKKEPRHVVIVGAGIAGLTCARELLSKCRRDVVHVTVLEASDRVGGRIQKIAVPSSTKTTNNDNDNENENDIPLYLDAGAEFIHGRGHILWDTIREYQRRGLLPTTPARTSGGDSIKEDEDEEEGGEPFEYALLEPYFILSHADGGPEDNPTPQGKFGMYYMDGELLLYNDPKVQPLADALEAILDPVKYDQYSDTTSVADALLIGREGCIPPLSDSLLQLCVAGFGNTAGCCELDQLSIRQLMTFEHYWETNEIEGDFRPTGFGLYSVVDAMMQELAQDHSQNCEFRLNSPVQRILPAPRTEEDLPSTASTSHGKIKVQFEEYPQDETIVMENADDTTLSAVSANVLRADAVVVTVPPTRVSQLFDNGRDLPPSKREALERIGFADRVVKVCCMFRHRSSCFFWPKNVQSIIAAGQPIPEMWIREYVGESCNVVVVVGYLVSTAADQLMDQVRREMQQGQQENSTGKECLREYYAGRIMLQQLSTMLRIPMQEIEKEWLQDDTLLVDWKEDFPYVQGGYMFPKIGMKTGQDLHALAEPMMDGRVFFAGEATNINACCTVQAAMETGIRAAKEILQSMDMR